MNVSVLRRFDLPHDAARNVPRIRGSRGIANPRRSLSSGGGGSDEFERRSRRLRWARQSDRRGEGRAYAWERCQNQ